MPPPGHPDHPVGAEVAWIEGIEAFNGFCKGCLSPFGTAQRAATEVQPFANQNGGVDDTLGPPKIYMYGPAASPLGRAYAVDCDQWHALEAAQQAQKVDEVLQVLQKNGFVVLENMVPKEGQEQMEAEAIRHFDSLPAPCSSFSRT